MSECDVSYVVGDTGSVHGPVTCRDKAGTVIDLTGASAKLIYSMNGEASVSKTMTVNSPETDGKVQYQFLTGELTEGVMQGEVEVTDSAGDVITELCVFTRNVRAKI